MTQVIDPATATAYETPDAGTRFVAVEMTVDNIGSETIDDDANLDVSVVGTDSQGYTADFDSVSECTNFDSGEFTLTPGQSEIGCVVFQLPTDVNVETIGFNDSAPGGIASWTP
jgi:hypothetical protein